MSHVMCPLIVHNDVCLMYVCYIRDCVLQILFIMEPDSWSAASMYQATRIFSSSLSVKMAQRLCILELMSTAARPGIVSTTY